MRYPRSLGKHIEHFMFLYTNTRLDFQEERDTDLRIGCGGTCHYPVYEVGDHASFYTRNCLLLPCIEITIGNENEGPGTARITVLLYLSSQLPKVLKGTLL